MDDGVFVPCDACGHRSYVFGLLPSGGSVSYCGSHGTRFWGALNAQAVFVEDRRADIPE